MRFNQPVALLLGSGQEQQSDFANNATINRSVNATLDRLDNALGNNPIIQRHHLVDNNSNTNPLGHHSHENPDLNLLTTDEITEKIHLFNSERRILHSNLNSQNNNNIIYSNNIDTDFSIDRFLGLDKEQNRNLLSEVVDNNNVDNCNRNIIGIGNRVNDNDRNIQTHNYHANKIAEEEEPLRNRNCNSHIVESESNRRTFNYPVILGDGGGGGGDRIYLNNDRHGNVNGCPTSPESAAVNVANNNNNEMVLMNRNVNNYNVSNFHHSQSDAGGRASSGSNRGDGGGGRGGGESSPDDSYMEEEDIGSRASSSCASLDSPEPSYPRGIINPNYPGFQHLAHTLAEHFSEHNSLSKPLGDDIHQLSDSDCCSDEEEEDDDDEEEGEGEEEPEDVEPDNEECNKQVISSKQMSLIVDDSSSADNFQKTENTDEVSLANPAPIHLHKDMDMAINSQINAFLIDEHNINLLLKSEEKKFCEEKSLALLTGDRLSRGANVNNSYDGDEDNLNDNNNDAEELMMMMAIQMGDEERENRRHETDKEEDGKICNQDDSGFNMEYINPVSEKRTKSRRNHLTLDFTPNVKRTESVTDIKCNILDLIPMTPDILIKNIDVNVETSLQNQPSSPTTACLTFGRKQNVLSREQSLNSFQPDLLRNIDTSQDIDSCSHERADEDVGKLLENYSNKEGEEGVAVVEKNREKWHPCGTDGNYNSTTNSISATRSSPSMPTKAINIENSKLEEEYRHQIDTELATEDASSRPELETQPEAITVNKCNKNAADMENVNLNNNEIFINEGAPPPEDTDDAELLRAEENRAGKMASSADEEDVIPLANNQQIIMADEGGNLPEIGTSEETYQIDQMSASISSSSSSISGASSLAMAACSTSDVMVAMAHGHIWNSSPIDIVGDFGKEVEREIGLIVSGYGASALTNPMPVISSNGNRQLKMTCCSPSSTNIGHSPDLSQKMADAALSNARDAIAFRSLAVVDKSNSSADYGFACSSSSSALNHDHHQQFGVLCPTTGDFSGSISGSGGGVSLECQRSALPTAIVKPKYQKSSHDERQLPIAVGGHVDYYFNHHQQQPVNNLSSSGRNNKPPVNSSSVNNYRNGVSAIVAGGGGGGSLKSNSSKCGIASGHHHSQTNNTGAKKSVRSLLLAQNNLNNNSVYNNINNNNVKQKNCADRGVEKESVIGIVTPIRKKVEKVANMEGKNCVNIDNSVNKLSGDLVKMIIDKDNMDNADNRKSKLEEKQPESDILSKKNKNSTTKENSAGFDVYNFETALPVIDLEAIENHLRAAKEKERRRRNDREEIRRRLAMGDDYLYNKFAGSGVERPARKPSLQSRLQSGMNLQICFMNETASDTESPSSDSESCPKLSKSTSNASSLSHSSHSNLSTQHRYNHQNNNNNNLNNNHSSVDDIRSSQCSLRESLSSSPYNARPLTVNKLANKLESRLLTTTSNVRPNSLQLSTNLLQTTAEGEQQDQDFFTKQARLQIEARMALAQAKDMAHMQMEIEKQRQKHSPITEVIRNSLEKVGSPMPPEKRRVSRQMLTDMNIAQLQVIVNELHTHIEFLNESLVQFLMERDELHMSQDSMLVDIEDLTRYLDAKEQSRSSSSLSLGSNSSQSGKNVINNNNNNTAISTRSQLFPSPKQSRDANSNHIGGNSTASQPAHPSKFLRIASLVKK